MTGPLAALLLRNLSNFKIIGRFYSRVWWRRVLTIFVGNASCRLVNKDHWDFALHPLAINWTRRPNEVYIFSAYFCVHEFMSQMRDLYYRLLTISFCRICYMKMTIVVYKVEPLWKNNPLTLVLNMRCSLILYKTNIECCKHTCLGLNVSKCHIYWKSIDWCYMEIQRKGINVKEHHWILRLPFIKGPGFIILMDISVTGDPWSSKYSHMLLLFWFVP